MHKQIFVPIFALLALFFIAGCKHQGQSGQQSSEDSTAAVNDVPDSTIFGVCGDGTMMHTLQLVTDGGDTLAFVLNADDSDEDVVFGGLLAGDRLAVTANPETDGERVATRVINLTTLQGRWTSLDRNFEIMEDGKVKADVVAEHHPWTNWKILNGRLVLSADTFDIYTLGSDSLGLENKDGIFIYKRQTANNL